MLRARRLYQFTHFPNRLLSSAATGSREYLSGMGTPSGRPKWLISTTALAPLSKQCLIDGTAALILCLQKEINQFLVILHLHIHIYFLLLFIFTSGCWWLPCPSWARWNRPYVRKKSVSIICGRQFCTHSAWFCAHKSILSWYMEQNFMEKVVMFYTVGQVCMFSECTYIRFQ